MRHRPEDYGYTPDGEPAVEHQARARQAGAIDFRPKEALRTRAFWFLSFGQMSALLVVSSVTVHMVPHVTENLGYTLSTAGLVVALQTSVQIGGQVVGGFLGDRISKRWLCVGCMAGHSLGLLVLAYAQAFWMIALFAVLHGFAWGVRGPLMSAMRADYFGRASYGVVTGLSSMVLMLGQIAGPLVAGILADRTGNYETGFTVLAVMAALGLLFFALATKPRPPDRSGDREIRSGLRAPEAAVG